MQGMCGAFLSGCAMLDCDPDQSAAFLPVDASGIVPDDEDAPAAELEEIVGIAWILQPVKIKAGPFVLYLENAVDPGSPANLNALAGIFPVSVLPCVQDAFLDDEADPRVC